MLKTECEVEGKENMEVEKSLVSIYNIYSNPIWCSQENPCRGKILFFKEICFSGDHFNLWTYTFTSAFSSGKKFIVPKWRGKPCGHAHTSHVLCTMLRLNFHSLRETGVSFSFMPTFVCTNSLIFVERIPFPSLYGERKWTSTDHFSLVNAKQRKQPFLPSFLRSPFFNSFLHIPGSLLFPVTHFLLHKFHPWGRRLVYRGFLSNYIVLIHRLWSG